MCGGRPDAGSRLSGGKKAELTTKSGEGGMEGRAGEEENLAPPPRQRLQSTSNTTQQVGMTHRPFLVAKCIMGNRIILYSLTQVRNGGHHGRSASCRRTSKQGGKSSKQGGKSSKQGGKSKQARWEISKQGGKSKTLNSTFTHSIPPECTFLHILPQLAHKYFFFTYGEISSDLYRT